MLSRSVVLGFILAYKRIRGSYFFKCTHVGIKHGKQANYIINDRNYYIIVYDVYCVDD